jgi:hypothetical protein
MKDKERNLDEIEVSHTRWSGGRSCPWEREVERVHMLLYCQIRDIVKLSHRRNSHRGLGFAKYNV